MTNCYTDNQLNSFMEAAPKDGELVHIIVFNLSEELLIARTILREHNLLKQFEDTFEPVNLEDETK